MESLAEHPAAEREVLRIEGNLVRLSVGVEEADWVGDVRAVVGSSLRTWRWRIEGMYHEFDYKTAEWSLYVPVLWSTESNV